MRLRDSQRAKVYKAERLAFDKREGVVNERLESTAEISRWVNGYVLKMKRVRDIIVPADPKRSTPAFSWFQKFLMYEGRHGKGSRLVNIQDGAGCRRALAFSHEWRIEMPKWARKKWVIIHELAHLLAPSEVRHQWEFCHVFLKLTLYVLGKAEHDALKAAMKTCRVRFTPPRKAKPMSEERKAALRARLVLARAARAKPTN